MDSLSTALYAPVENALTMILIGMALFVAVTIFLADEYDKNFRGK